MNTTLLICIGQLGRHLYTRHTLKLYHTTSFRQCEQVIRNLTEQCLIVQTQAEQIAEFFQIMNRVFSEA